MTFPDTDPRPGLGRSPAALGLVILAALWMAAGIRFLLFPPGHDFLGDMYWVDVLSPHVWSGRLPDWNPGVAMGHPTLLQRMNLMLFLPAIALKALVGDTETAARLYLLLAHTLSGAAFYALARLYVRRRAVAAFAALLYLVAPLHVAELTLYGHWALAQSFALSPLVLALVVHSVRERGRAGFRFGLALAVAAAWLAWADNERTATLLPLVLAFAAFEIREQAAGERAAAARRLGAAALLAAGLAAGFLLPGVVDRHQLAIFSTSNPGEAPFELWHPALLLDRLWSLARLPFFAGTMHPVAHVHVGWVSAVLAAGAVLGSRRETGSRRRLVLALALTSVFVVLISMGTNAVASSTYEAARSVGGTGAGAAALIGLVGAFAAVAGLVFRRHGAVAGLATAAAGAYVLVGSPWLLISRIPPYDGMRNVLWFLTVNLPVLLALLSALLLEKVEAVRAGAVRTLAAVALLAWLDLSGYLLLPPGFSPATRELYQSLGRVLRADPDSFRIAWTPFVLSHAEEAYADRLLRQRDSGSWIIWCATRWAAPAITKGDAYMQEARRLRRRGGDAADAAVERALRHFADSDVKYFLITRAHASFRPLFGRGLTPVLEAGPLLVARNDFWAPGGGSGPGIRRLEMRRPGEERIDATFEGSGTLLVSESYHPYWTAELDGRPVEVTPVRDTFLGIRAATDGAHHLILRYRTPWYYPASAAVSLLSAFAAAALAAWRRGRGQGGSGASASPRRSWIRTDLG